MGSRGIVGLVAGLAAGWLWGCGDGGAFGCVETAQCVDGGVQGTCQPAGYCSFPDDGCDSGQRYGDFGPMGLAGECVPPPDSDTEGDGGDGAGATDDTGSPPPPGSTSTPVGDDGSTGGPTTGPAVDDTGAESTGPPLPQTETTTFGERDDSDVGGVTRDTWIVAGAPENNSGAHIDLHFGGGGAAVVLVAFDLSALPPGTTITEASLEMVVELGTPADMGTLEVYALTEAWEEGTANQAAGVANWTQRTLDEAWTNPGAGTGSHDPQLVAELDPMANDTPHAIDLPTELVQAWIDDPALNHGLVMHDSGINEVGWFYSAEYGDATKRPELTVTYVPRGT
jgi:hypothetical protein